MSTKTSPARKGARKRPQRRSSSSRKAPKKTAVRTVLAPWARDALGIGLLVLALLAVLSLWLEAGGPLGNAIAWLLPALFGLGASTFPVFGLWWGFVLLRDTARDDRVRMFIGFAVLIAGLLGLVSLARGNPGVADGWGGSRERPGFGEAGGLIGLVVAGPLAGVISPAGAAIVCAGLTALGVLIFSGTPFAVVTAKVREFRDERDEREPVGAQ